MGKGMQRKAQELPPPHILFVLAAGWVVFNFCLFPLSPSFQFSPVTYTLCALMLFSSMAGLFFLWLALAERLHAERSTALTHAAIILSPLLMLMFWDRQSAPAPALFPIAVVVITQLCFFAVLSQRGIMPLVPAVWQKSFLTGFLLIYTGIFCYIGFQQLSSFDFFNSKDFAIYNQTFWNSIHGRWFANSAYGSNFTCHNSLFFFFLMPFYYAFPSAYTLLVLKIALFALAAVPFYLIAKDMLGALPAIPLTLGMLFYPYLVSQNFTAPHEICFAPLFILWTYYFYRKKRFWLFLVLLIISLSIKEHLALIAVMFGLLGFVAKREAKWSIVPFVLGIAWLAFSLWIIAYFQAQYHPHQNAAWFLVQLQKRFLVSGDAGVTALKAFSLPNIARWQNVRQALLLISPLGFVLPLLSPVLLLGLPELVLPLLSDWPVMLSPHWHYNVVLSCFLLIGTAEGIQKVSRGAFGRRLAVSPEALRLLLAVFVFGLTLIHAHTWLAMACFSRDECYENAVTEALSYVPADAFVSVPRRLAIAVSQRERYALVEEADEKGLGTYIILDHDSAARIKPDVLAAGYAQLFNKNGVRVFKKIR